MNSDDNAKQSEGDVISIGYTQSGSYDDDDYYELVFEKAEASAIVRHRWHHWRPKRIDQRSEELTLEQLKTKSFQAYERATRLLAEKGFPPRNLTKEPES